MTHNPDGDVDSFHDLREGKSNFNKCKPRAKTLLPGARVVGDVTTGISAEALEGECYKICLHKGLYNLS